ncbi:GNAT family N-acetyltransferase [Planococcus dechangensis]|uniref:GNAT family N-acetyltransferase n=1 Tax=Planococcus dechangensis TaxID=1176255 RepID=A0ABV9M9F7_9BACL
MTQSIRYKRLINDAGSLSFFRQLNSLFAEAFDETDTYLGHQPTDEYLLSLLSKDHVIVCVALMDDRVAGGLVAYVLDKFEQQRSEVYIYDLAVDSQHRRKRIATELIVFLKKEATELGARVVFVQADPIDTAAVILYESLGIRENVCHFDFELKNPPDK